MTHVPFSITIRTLGGGNSMAVKVAINGFGRIGRNFVRCSADDPEIEIVGINDITKPETLAHLLKYDSVLGRFDKHVAIDNGNLVIAGRPVKIFSEKDPGALDWNSTGATVVVESTGKFTNGETAKAHLGGTVRKIIISAPGTNVDGMFCMGVNHEKYDPAKHHIISNASCTTTCLAPVVKALDDNFGIEIGFMTTVHSYTNDQNLLDLPHKDMRRARAAAVNIVPSTTGAAKAIGQILPHLAGKLDGFALRVPTPNVSLVDLVVTVRKPAVKDEVNQALKAASEGAMKGFLGYSDEPLVSSDYMRSTFSGVVDALLTKASGNLIKVIAWYDNEWGYSCRLLDLVRYAAK